MNTEFDVPYYMAFDPGKDTGWVQWNHEGRNLIFGTSDPEGLNELLDSVVKEGTVQVIIYEDFTLYGHKAVQQSGSNMPASKAIGKIETTAYKLKANLIKQPANIKPIAQLWTGHKPKHNKDPNRHWIDAYNHGEYYMIKNGIKEIKL